ncbi:MAG: DNA alkylation repair protein [Clostridia bacterium]|nr:DNA alkylation repair protein [Clostridia bacterium]
MELTRSTWSRADYEEFINHLKSLADEKYKKFNDALVPGEEHSIGVRVPQLRSIAKEISKGNYTEFLACKKGQYREEIMLQGLVMALIKCDYPEMLSYMKEYADMITSWETCDIVSFKGMKKYLPQLFSDIEYFIYNENPWVVRYGFGILLEFYLTDEYIDRVLKYVDSVNSDFYYIQMMQGWLVATAAAKCRDKTIKYLADNNLNAMTQNMAIRKMRESLRISKEDKELVLSFKK